MSNRNSTRKQTKRKVDGICTRLTSIQNDLLEIAKVYAETHPDHALMFITLSNLIEPTKSMIERSKENL